jgi:GST-like protein
MTIELYSLATPNGQKIAIALEELDVPYNAHTIDIRNGEQFKPDFLKISPNNKIPAIVDTETGISIFESGSILIYLADKYGKFLPGTDNLALRTETLTWLFWQVAGLGPNLGQLAHFYRYAQAEEEHLQYSKQRFLDEVKRLYGVLEKQFEKHGGDYVVGTELTIADFAIYPWLKAAADGPLKEYIGDHQRIDEYIKRMNERPAVQKGLKVTSF